MSGCCCSKCKSVEQIQTAAVANGNGDVFDVLGYPAVSFQVYGTFAGGTDVAFEFLTGLSTWEPLPVKNASTGVVTMTGIVSAAGTYIANTVGLQKVRARVLNYAGADSINVVATAVCEGDGTAVGGGGSGGLTGDVNVASWGGTATTLGRKAAAASVPTVMSTEDKAALDLIDTDLDTLNAVFADVHDASKDALRTIPSPSTTANTPAIVTAAASDALAANAARKLWSIQNLGTNPLFVRLGTGATTAIFHFILKPGSAADDGNGGFMSDEVWKGIVSYAGTSPRLVVTELT